MLPKQKEDFQSENKTKRDLKKTPKPADKASVFQQSRMKDKERRERPLLALKEPSTLQPEISLGQMFEAMSLRTLAVPGLVATRAGCNNIQGSGEPSLNLH